MSELINKIILGDSLCELGKIPSNSVDLVLTDPPYFLDKLDSNWKREQVNNKNNQQVIKSLPAGMKFDRSQGIEFYNWYINISKEVFRILKSGGFFFSFSSPRLYHRMASAIDDAGFEIRDCFSWLYTQNQAKAMSLSHFIRKLDISNEEQEKLLKKLDGWKTPQIKSCFEPISFAQKPTEGTFLNNQLKYNVGLVNTNIKLGDGRFPSNVISTEEIGDYIDTVFLVNKPTKKEKGQLNDHKTVKPVDLCKYLIAISTQENAIVLDPFMGSGTTAVACKELKRNFIGIELNQEYIDISNKRLRENN